MVVQAGILNDVAGSSDQNCRLGKLLPLPALEMTRVRSVVTRVGVLQGSATKPASLPFSLIKRDPPPPRVEEPHVGAGTTGASPDAKPGLPWVGWGAWGQVVLLVRGGKGGI